MIGRSTRLGNRSSRSRRRAGVVSTIRAISRSTLAADLRKGNRPSFIRAVPPDVAEPLLRSPLCTRLRAAGLEVATGRFGAHMAVHLTNDGPVTI
jgi:D-tyrosyl-tRNA(Tyr) deacylase